MSPATTAFALERPLQSGGRSYPELRLRRPRIKDWRAAAGRGSDGYDGAVILVARMAGVCPHDLAEQIGAADLARVVELVAGMKPPAAGRA